MSFVEIGPPNERQGEYIRTDLYVWNCGDPDCDCSQVVCERRYQNRLADGAIWTVLIWKGEYYAEGEGTPEHHGPELLQALREVRERYPDEKWGTIVTL
ncbi:MAG: hypothetical protein JWM95_1379 [Gemmatimonadetes bacterium]|nr:hypothetical protein [Gemmatimonadota bacterium]